MYFAVWQLTDLDVVVFVGKCLVADEEVQVLAPPVDRLSDFGPAPDPDGRGDDVLGLKRTGVAHFCVPLR